MMIKKFLATGGLTAVLAGGIAGVAVARCTIPRQRPRRRPRSSTSGQPDRPRRGSKSQTARPPRPRPMAPAATRTSAGRISTTSSTAWSERGWCPPGRMNAPDGHHPGAPDGRRLHRGPVLRRSGRRITSVINGAMTSWVLRDTRLPAHGACPPQGHREQPPRARQARTTARRLGRWFRPSQTRYADSADRAGGPQGPATGHACPVTWTHSTTPILDPRRSWPPCSARCSRGRS